MSRQVSAGSTQGPAHRGTIVWHRRASPRLILQLPHQTGDIKAAASCPQRWAQPLCQGWLSRSTFPPPERRRRKWRRQDAGGGCRCLLGAHREERQAGQHCCQVRAKAESHKANEKKMKLSVPSVCSWPQGRVRRALPRVPPRAVQRTPIPATTVSLLKTLG